MKVTHEIKCPGCKLGTRVRFKKPSILSPSIFQYACENCESTVIVRMTLIQQSQNPSGQKGNCNVAAKITKVGPILLEMLREEAADRAAVEAENNAPISNGDAIEKLRGLGFSLDVPTSHDITERLLNDAAKDLGRRIEENVDDTR